MGLQLTQLLLLVPGLPVVVPDPLGSQVVLPIQQLLRQQLVSALLGRAKPLLAVDLKEEVDGTVPAREQWTIESNHS